MRGDFFFFLLLSWIMQFVWLALRVLGKSADFEILPHRAKPLWLKIALLCPQESNCPVSSHLSSVRKYCQNAEKRAARSLQFLWQALNWSSITGTYCYGPICNRSFAFQLILRHTRCPSITVIIHNSTLNQCHEVKRIVRDELLLMPEAPAFPEHSIRL